ncbi:MAG: hypothetical protein CMF69_00375 [Magnetovibrio sp.]|nr:hypothetical protein [Magnetovibrio sp.]
MAIINLTQDQYDRLLARLTALEENHNNIAIAVDKFVTLDQVMEVLVILRTDIEDMQETVSSLEDRVTALEEEPLD